MCEIRLNASAQRLMANQEQLEGQGEMGAFLLYPKRFTSGRVFYALTFDLVPTKRQRGTKSLEKVIIICY